MRLTEKLGKVVTELADHHQLVTTRRLIEAGFTYRQVSGLHRDRLLERVAQGLYRIPGSRTPVQDAAAAVMRHRGSAASHTTGLHLHDVSTMVPARPHITVPRAATGRTSIGVLHRSPLDPAERTTRHGVPVTTLTRCVVDSAQLLSARQLARVVEEVVGRGMTDVATILAAAARLEAAPSRVGHRNLRAVLAPWTEAIKPGSPAEAAVIRRIVASGLPAPVTQHVVRDHSGAFVARLDLAWPERLVAREYDSDRHHTAIRAEADELRRQRIEALGWRLDVITRLDLHPSARAWLRTLADDLGVAIR